MKRLVWVLAVLPGIAVADRLAMLDAQGIEDALNGRSVIYADGATQDFRPSGATLYNAGRDTWGYWAVRGDQYCSQWPPSDGWTCYGVASGGTTVRFIAQGDSFTDGTYTD